MKRVWIGVLLLSAAALAGCRSGGRVAVTDPRAGTDPLKGFVGQRYVLLHFGDRKDATVRIGEPQKGGCDVAVQVAAANAVGDAVRFTLDSLGRVRIGDARPVGRCGGLASPIQLTVKGVNPARPDDWRDALGKVLATPEGFLSSHGKPFNYPQQPEPPLAASSSHASGNEEERRLGRKVTMWPKPVLTVEPAVASSGKVRHEGEVEFMAVVGADGRVFRPQVRTPLSEEHTQYVANVLQVWRFEPARENDRVVPARYEGRTVFKIY